MSNQPQKQLQGHTINLLRVEQKKASAPKPEQLPIIEKYRSRIKQLESERQHLSKKIEECYDYIEFQDYLVRKNDKKIQQLTKALYTPSGEASIVSIPAFKLRLGMILALVLYAISVFI